MDSLAANYASSDEDADEEGSQEQPKEEEAAKRNPSVVSNADEHSKPLQFPPPKPSPLFSSSLPPPKTSSSASFLSSIPPPKPFSSNLPPPLPSVSEQGSSRAGEEDGVKGQKGGIFSKVALPKPLFANPSSAPRAELGSNRISDDDDEEDQEDGVFTKVTSSAPFKAQNAIFSALPQPKTSSSSSLLSSLPPPKTTASNPQKSSNGPSSAQKPKKVVQFKPPIDLSFFRSSFDDDDEEDEKERDRSQDASSTGPKSFSSLIPAPKQTTLGSAPLGSSSTSRRSVIEADVPAESYGHLDSAQEAGHSVNYGSYDAGMVGVRPPEAGAEGVADFGYFAASNTDYSLNPTGAGGESWGQVGAEVVSYPGHAGNPDTSGWDPSHVVAADYGSYGNYEGNWYDTSGTVAASQVPDMGRITGKRGRNEIPVEIVEVKQDELMKNRPRQDKSKLTGMAFGPAYQQPTSSTKEKPSKLHKRKHQIGSLFFDMKQKEMELAERRARGLLTKTQTQGKYGW